MKRVVVVGSGTAGMISAAYLSRMRKSDREVILYYDPKIKPQAVGEGADLSFPDMIKKITNFEYRDLEEMDGSFKYGIRKLDWSTQDFVHQFPEPSVSYHFNAVKLQKYILNKISNRIKIVEENVSNDNIDADFILDCSGTPKEFSKFEVAEGIPVNAVHVTQCYWDAPRFNYTLAIARPYGWVFGIPLTNRCSIGYMYNHKINTIDEVKEDVKTVFDRFKLDPSEHTNSFTFNNYYRTNNFEDNRIGYNGNASFFLEPLEATSISVISEIAKMSDEFLNELSGFKILNNRYKNLIQQVETTISFHYLNNRIFETEFWDLARNISRNNVLSTLQTNNFFRRMMNKIVASNEEYMDRSIAWGTWSDYSFNTHIRSMELFDDMKELLEISGR